MSEPMTHAFLHATRYTFASVPLRLEARRAGGGAWIALQGFSPAGHLALDLSLDQEAIACLAPLFAEVLPDALASLAEWKALEVEDAAPVE